ncbi:Spermidine/putrescine-binding periplasmic protein 1 [Sesamum alatum]|uniref:Spermidine/putrescine-binding periplasmic protein 1 n=1 Tax=Sesamum alatum TaxID=300844 RepID=A0AAE1Y286_9LAMI|nr:Spermidine/putrescine-binding periplasmic protein 1 [Sesamum alatum]
MAVLSLPSLPGPTYSNPNPTRTWIRTPRYSPRHRSIKLTATLNNNPCSPAGDFLRQLSVSSVLLIGVGLSSLWAFSSPASARISPASPLSLAHAQETLDTNNGGEFENLENIEDEEMRAAFERWKSKTYALTVPLRIVALEGSLPPIWVREFLKSQGKRVRFRPEFRRSLRDIFHELSNPFNKGKINRKSAVAADLVTLGDSWLNFAIGKGLIEPMKGAEDQDWFQDLSDKWKVYLRRSSEGNLDSQGRIWAAPYRWGSMVIAYNKKEFQNHKLAPVEDWSDLWRPELAGKISMVDSPREIVGAVLKYMGASYNTTNIDSQVVGGKYAVLQRLELLVQQVRLFDSQDYLKAFRAGDVWVAVGWSSDVLPVAKTMSNVSVIVPKSGASLWADFWAVPNASRLVTDQIGGRVRGPSPLVEQWVEFCLQPERALPFKEEIIAGASPISLKSTVEGPQQRRNGRPKLDTNLIANIPPAEILSRCELLEPLSEDALSDYRWLIQSLQKPHHSIMNRLTRSISSTVPAFWSKLQSKAA